jgi:hypothetical protein
LLLMHHLLGILMSRHALQACVHVLLLRAIPCCIPLAASAPR